LKNLIITILFLILSSPGRIYSYNWILKTVDSLGLVGQYSSLDLDGLGNPHICYYEASSKDLRYAFYDGTSWHYDTVDAAGDVGRFCDIVIDSGNLPHISYFD
jgi:hypothetical protein